MTRSRSWSAVGAGIAVLLAAAGCGGSHATSTTTAHSGRFAYDASAPVGLRDRGVVSGVGAVAIHDVSYAVPGGRVEGFLLVPYGSGRVPGVLYLGGAGADRQELVQNAAQLAAHGAVALTITPPSSAAGAPPAGLTVRQEIVRERRLGERDVIAARRAIDVLRGYRRVDPSRIGLVGLSYGARTGAILAGVEPRIDDFVLMSGGADAPSSYVRSAPPAYRPLVRAVVTELDPLHWIARGRAATILLQDGKRDEVVPRAALLRLAKAAPHGTVLRWYDAGHLLDEAAVRDQIAWLAKKLPIGS